MTYSHGQRIDLRALYARDGGTYHLCGFWMDAPGVLHPNAPLAPTRDHLLPPKSPNRAKAENVRLAHRLCNIGRAHGKTCAELRAEVARAGGAR